MNSEQRACMAASIAQHCAMLAFKGADANRERETLVQLLGEPYVVPITMQTIETVVQPDFPDGSTESRACWRLLREVRDANDDRMMELLIERLTSTKGAKLLARVLTNDALSGRAAELLGRRADVLVRMPPYSVSLDSDAGMDAAIAIGLGDRLLPYAVAPDRVLKYLDILAPFIQNYREEVLTHFRCIAPGSALVTELERRFA